MFSNVIVGVDEHQGGSDAIALAKNLAARYADVRLVHIYPAAPAGRSSDLSDRDAHNRGRELLAAAREKAGTEARLTCVPGPSVGRGLHRVAELKRADLLVVGSSRQGLLGRVLLRDDTRAALNGAPCAVAIAPTGYSQQPAAMREIGVGYNGSAESEHALDLARKLAGEHGARLSAFEAVSLPLDGRGAGEAIGELVTAARQRIVALGGVEPHSAYGAAAEELALYGASVDLLIVGSRGYGPLGRLMYGSTSQQLARTARCPLLVLTRTRESATLRDSDEAEPAHAPSVP